jgi:hypothetical protein
MLRNGDGSLGISLQIPRLRRGTFNMLQTHVFSKVFHWRFHVCDMARSICYQNRSFPWNFAGVSTWVTWHFLMLSESAFSPGISLETPRLWRGTFHMTWHVPYAIRQVLSLEFHWRFHVSDVALSYAIRIRSFPWNFAGDSTLVTWHVSYASKSGRFSWNFAGDSTCETWHVQYASKSGRFRWISFQNPRLRTGTFNMLRSQHAFLAILLEISRVRSNTTGLLGFINTNTNGNTTTNTMYLIVLMYY